MPDYEKRFTDEAKKAFVGKTVANVRYMSETEANKTGFNRRAMIIEFDDGTYIFPSMDDEGNDAGAIFGGKYDTNEDYCFPVF
jgi:hypothetical protein